ncbi:MAG TPA: hypothetical protein VGY97_10285 [Solirubrobacteraceae bacterium]|nr:hypothetical protein [Solirubrobacteraceae bacterium]
MSRPSPALAISLIALFISLGGTGYAVSGVGHSPATVAKKKKHKKVTLIPGPQGAQGLRGPQGLQGIQGGAGLQGGPGLDGARGPSDAYHSYHASCDCGGPTSVTVVVPAGDYAAWATDAAFNSDAAAQTTTCTLASSSDTTAGHSHTALAQQQPPSTGSSVETQTVLHLPSGGSITASCTATSGSVNLSNLRLTAIQVGAEHG